VPQSLHWLFLLGWAVPFASLLLLASLLPHLPCCCYLVLLLLLCHAALLTTK
jgi:hypothetical protein